MKIIEEYKSIIEEIAITKSKLTTAERELQRNMYEYRPSEMKAIDYSKDKVQSSNCQQSILVTAHNIVELNKDIFNLKEDLQGLYNQKNNLEIAINSLGDIENKIIMCKLKGLSNKRIARQLYITERTVYRYIKKIEENKSCHTLSECIC